MPALTDTRRPASRPLLVQAVVIAVVLLAGIVSAVTVEPESRATLAVADIRAASSAARAASTANAEMTMTFKIGDQQMSLNADGAFDFGRQRSRFVFDLGQFTGGSSTGLGTMELVADGGTAYIRSTAFSSRLPGGKAWISTTLPAGAVPAAGDPFGDPAAYLDYLESASGNVKRIGDERVRGAATTHYSAVISVEALLDSATGQARTTAEQAFATAGVSEMLSYVWIDDDGLPRRMEMRVDSGKVDFTFRLEMFDFGTDVSIDVPDPSETMSVPTMADLQRMFVPGAAAS